jgi:hypothetical protein
MMHPKLLDRLKCKSKGENNERIKSWGTLFGSQHFKGEGCARAPKWGLGRLTSESIIHLDLYKPNNKLINAYLEHFWCTNKSQDSPPSSL